MSKWELLRVDGSSSEPMDFRAACRSLATMVNTGRRGTGKHRASPVVFGYMDCEGNLQGELMNLSSIRLPPFFDWGVIAGKGGKHSARTPRPINGCVRPYIELEDEDVE